MIKALNVMRFVGDVNANNWRDLVVLHSYSGVFLYRKFGGLFHGRANDNAHSKRGGFGATEQNIVRHT